MEKPEHLKRQPKLEYSAYHEAIADLSDQFLRTRELLTQWLDRLDKAADRERQLREAPEGGITDEQKAAELKIIQEKITAFRRVSDQLASELAELDVELRELKIENAMEDQVLEQVWDEKDKSKMS